MRLFIKILAWVVLYLGGAMAVGSLLFLLAMAGGYVGAGNPKLDRSGLMFMSASLSVMAILFYLIARQAWKHLRKPDRKSANSIVGLASFFLGVEIVRQVTKYAPPHKPGEADPQIELAVGLVVLLACYLLYRFALKPLAARAFPADEPPAAPLTSGS